MGFLRRLVGCALVCASCVTPCVAAAQPPPQTKDVRDLARTFATRGHALLQEGKVDDAIELLERARTIYSAPTISLYLARAYERKGALLRAREVYREIAAQDLGNKPPKEFVQAKRDAASEEAKLSPEVPTLEVVLLPGFVEPVEVTIDGAVVKPGKTDVDPGERRVVAVGADGRRDVQVVSAVRGKSLRIELKAPMLNQQGPGQPADSGISPLMAGGISLLAIGGAGLIAGAVTGGLAVDRADQFHDACPSEPCSNDTKPLYDEADRFATASTVTLIVGGGLAAVGVALLIGDLATKPSQAPKVEVGLGRLSFTGVFQ